MQGEKCWWFIFVAGYSHQLVELIWRDTLPKEIQTDLV